MKISPIITGTMRWGIWGADHSVAEVQKLIETSIECGFTTFDHADIYGGYTTEKLFGDAWVEMKIPRETVQFISKCDIEYPGGIKPYELKTYNYSKDHIIQSVDESLNNLRTDYLDLLLLHRPSPLMNPPEISMAFRDLLESGKVRNFGVSNFTTSQFDLIDEFFPLLTNQIEISVNKRDSFFDGTLDQLMLNHLRPMAWSPFGNYFTEDSTENQRIRSVITELCEKYGAEEDQLLLAWLLKHPSGIIPVIGSSRAERIRKSKESLKINLERVDWFRLLIAAQGHKVP